MRGRLVATVILSSLFLAGMVLPVSADPQEGDVVAQGQILLGIPFYEVASRAVYGDQTSLPGPHAFTFDARGLDGLWLWPQVDDGTGTGYLVGIHYLDDSGSFIETKCDDAPGSTALATEPYGRLGVMIQCLVPPDARWAYVYAGAGVLLDVTVVISAGPPPLPDGVIADETVFAGVPLGQHALWWMLGGQNTPSMFSVRGEVTGLAGTRIVTDVADNGGLGHDVRLEFLDERGYRLDAECAPMPGASHPLGGGTALRWSETCIAPPGAIKVDAVVHHGHDLRITLRTA